MDIPLAGVGKIAREALGMQELSVEEQGPEVPRQDV